MKRGDLYKKILCFLLDKVKLTNNLSDDDVDDYKDVIDFTTETTERNWFPNINFGKYQRFVDGIRSTDKSGAEIELTVPQFVGHKSILTEDEEEYRPLVVNDTISELGLVTYSSLHECTNGDPNSPIDGLILTVITSIWSAYIADNSKMNDFWSICEDSTKKGYFVVYKENINNDKLWEAFAYACLYNVNSNKFPIPEKLKFNSEQKFHSSLVFDKETIYSQYFDVIHVLSEAKYCTDILSRFLVAYQVIEDLCYRRLLCAIASAQLRKSGFLLNASRILGKKESEEEDIKKGMKELFPDLDRDISDSDLTPFNSFIEKTYGIKPGDPHSTVKLAKIFYKLRNSIVHNKHSEMHFSYGNVAEYNVIIPLLKRFVNVLEPKIISILNDHEISIIDYPNKIMRVY